MLTGKKVKPNVKAMHEVSFGYSRLTPLAAGDDPYSDTETVRQHQRGSQGQAQYKTSYQGDIQMRPAALAGAGAGGGATSGVERTPLPEYFDGNVTDEDNGDPQMLSLDEFGDSSQVTSKLVRTGRQRKKSAARSKGGEFQARRKKRRIYFCCVSSEIDVHKLHDYFVGAGGTMNGWKFQVTADVLHLYKGGADTSSPRAAAAVPPSTGPIDARFEDDLGLSMPTTTDLSSLRYKREMDSNGTEVTESVVSGLDSYLTAPHDQLGFALRDPSKRRMSDESLPDLTRLGLGLGLGLGELPSNNDIAAGITRQNSLAVTIEAKEEDCMRMSSAEVFVFEFGAVVFWGFPRGEEINLLKTIRMFVTKGFVGPEEFTSGIDDMAFVTSPEVDVITIANDVLTIPDDAPSKQRLSVSFAIAQSTVLAIFESRVYELIEEYKYIPESLAAYGRVHLSERQLGKMIGDVFVIRHDVNLHTEILDTPDFFWKDGEKFEGDYKLLMRYLEMSQRTEVLNKRLDMLRELLDVLQQQMENAHAVKLEWIVIWLIVIEVVLQAVAIGGESMGFWGSGGATKQVFHQ